MTLGVKDGSSPRVWGTSRPQDELSAILRFIPTCVGNMKQVARASFGSHGSSPRVWGTLRRRRKVGVAGRFIPTCVGNMP